MCIRDSTTTTTITTTTTTNNNNNNMFETVITIFLYNIHTYSHEGQDTCISVYKS